MTTYHSKSKPGVGLFQPLSISPNLVVLEEVNTNEIYNYPFYIEDKEYRENYDTVFMNRKWDIERALDTEYLSEKFTEYEFRPMFFGEHLLFNLYKGLMEPCPVINRVLLDKDKLFNNDFSQIRDKFDNFVAGVVEKGKLTGFFSHRHYQFLIKRVNIPRYILKYLQKKGIDPYRDIIC